MATIPQEESPFIKEVAQGAEMAEKETTLTVQRGADFETDSEFLGFKPKDIKRGPSLTPNNNLIIFTIYVCTWYLIFCLYIHVMYSGYMN